MGQDLPAAALQGLSSRESPQHLSSSPWVRCSETCACVGSVSILEAGMFAAELVGVLRIVAASARMAPSVATSWIMSLASPLALLGRTRCKSPISSGFKFHSVSS